MAWVIIANLKGAPGDAAALGRFEAIESALDDHQAQIDVINRDMVRTDYVVDNVFAFQDRLGKDFLRVMDLYKAPYFEGSTPPNTENLPESSGDSFEVTDIFGHLLFAIDDMTTNPHFRGSSGSGFTETHFIFGVGQSNSVGIGTPSPVGTNNGLPNLFTIPQRGPNADVEVKATDPLYHPYADPLSGSVGHVWTVARTYALENPNVRVIVIGLAKSGSGFWSPGDPSYSWAPSREGESGITSLYRNAINKANAAIADYSGTKRVAMFVWHQGEGDAVGETTQASYETELTDLINGFRSQITNAADAIFLIGQTGWEFRNVRAPGTWAQIDAAHQNMPNLVTGTAFAPAPPQGYVQADNTHFTGLGQKLLAESFISVQQDAYFNV
ncbi:sialate O-acetylesterase [Glutamicibacter nicotianae]|uniref:sialate O-acetylesterase n=1 Tax=Glutamicibacter nicotianae TaxID=37929 RepID=UPI002552E90D|nr:sialate O-acetylesterase [Glutamicibacter nicotianae]WIV42596.1 sialate O-acetylesterase [Glutamicibacter nicotianae]